MAHESAASVGIAAFVAHLKTLGIVLTAAGDRLRLSAPKDVLTPALRDQLQQRKTEILAYLSANAAPEPLVVTPIGRAAPIDLAVAQERIWFLHQMAPTSSAYHVGGAVRLTGRFVPAAFELSWSELTQRHELLRTVFTTVDGRPVMRILPSAVPSIDRVDLAALPAQEREEAMIACALAAQARPFDIERGPCWRVSVIRMSDTEHATVLSMHHLIADYWSLAILSGEFCSLYAGHLAGRPTLLPALRVQFADFAVAQRAWLEGPRLQGQLAYWRAQLAGLTVAELPLDRPRTAGAAAIPAKGRVALSSPLLSGLRELAAAERATLYMVMVAAFNVVLSRYTGSTDVTVGTPISNRPSDDVERVVGMFVNTLVFRTNVAGNPSFRDLLRRVRDVALDAYANQDVSFDQLVSALRPERDGRSPFFQVLFNVLNAPTKVLRLEGLEFSPVRLPPSAAQFDLNVMIESQNEEAEHNALTFFYDRALFDPATMERMFGHYMRVLDLVVATPDIALDAIDLLGDAERQQQLGAWNTTAQPLPDDQTVVSLFETRAKATPDAVAVICGEASITYAGLNARANAIAAGLRRLDLGDERLVGICLHRSIDMVAALYGVLKAGAAYIPLDPTFPADRLAFMVEDATAAVILSEKGLRATLPPSGTRVVCLDEPADLFWQATPDERPSAPPRQADRAYILYTSGSTGRPKGVEIGHRAFVNFLLSMSRAPGMTAADRLLAVTTLSFDIAGLELCLPLITGARIVLATRDEAMDPARLADLIRRHAITVMQATPATWRLLLDDGWTGADGLTVLCGGEAMPRDLANRLVPAIRALWNMYGPTETTVWSTVERVTSGDDTISIGRPIDNTLVYVLDAQLQVTPVGVPGELFIGGEGVARGYFRRPELTASRFVTNPFSSRPDARMYRTGDLARFRGDGRLEYLGRLDSQVKVRGFRIELGEIESVLMTCRGVKQAAVVVRNDHGDAALAAYVVPLDGGSISADTVREHARQHLPPYMIPAFIVEIGSLPLTPNGKVDRKALPAPPAPAAEAMALPTNDTESAVAAIWAEVLKLSVGTGGREFFRSGRALATARPGPAPPRRAAAAAGVDAGPVPVPDGQGAVRPDGTAVRGDRQSRRPGADGSPARRARTAARDADP